MADGLNAKLSEELEKAARFQGGWKRNQDTCIQTPQYVPEITSKVDWKRTTLVKREGKWLLMETCEPLHAMADQEEAIEGITEKQLVLTILTKEGMSAEEMGFEVEEALPRCHQPNWKPRSVSCRSRSPMCSKSRQMDTYHSQRRWNKKEDWSWAKCCLRRLR